MRTFVCRAGGANTAALAACVLGPGAWLEAVTYNRKSCFQQTFGHQIAFALIMLQQLTHIA